MEGEKIRITKERLCGTVRVSGAKNSALKLLTASILTEEPVHLTDFPTGLLDIQIHLEMLKVLGKECSAKSDYVEITEEPSKSRNILNWENRSIRNTLLILGALTTRFGEAKVPLPGDVTLVKENMIFM